MHPILLLPIYGAGVELVPMEIISAAPSVVKHKSPGRRAPVSLTSVILSMKSIISKGVLGILFCCQCCQPSVQAQASDASAETLLQRMAEAYASAKTYSDEGTVCDSRNGERDSSSTTFRIYFVRPDQLRFEMTNNVGSPHFPEEHKILCTDGRQTCSWWQSNPQIITNRDVFSGISGFTGISGRAAHNIPSLLQTNFGWQEYLYDISSPRVLRDRVFNKTACYRIQGKGRGNRQYEIWIGKSDHFIRKIQTTYPDFYVEEIHENIAVDRPIAGDIFTLTPPKSSEEAARK